jgi:integrase
MRFAAVTAMRRGEQFTLRWDELDRESRTIGIWRKNPQEGKVYSRVPLLTEAMEIINSQAPEGDFIFNVSSNHAARVFNIYRDMAGIKDLVWHDLRHEGVSRLIEMGIFSPFEVMMFSGHRDIQMVEWYTHLRAETIVDNLKDRGM